MIHVASVWLFLVVVLGVILYRKLVVKATKTVIKEADKAAQILEEEKIEINKD